MDPCWQSEALTMSRCKWFLKDKKVKSKALLQNGKKCLQSFYVQLRKKWSQYYQVTGKWHLILLPTQEGRAEMPFNQEKKKIFVHVEREMTRL